MKEEREIKRFLLPYQSILKVTRTNRIRDYSPLKKDVRKDIKLSWGMFEFECQGTTKVVTKLYQYIRETGEPTGVLKDNVEGDPDYIPSESFSGYCPL